MDDRKADNIDRKDEFPDLDCKYERYSSMEKRSRTCQLKGTKKRSSTEEGENKQRARTEEGKKKRSSTDEGKNKQRSSTDEGKNKQRSSTEEGKNKQRSSTEEGKKKRSTTEEGENKQKSSTEEGKKKRSSTEEGENKQRSSTEEDGLGKNIKKFFGISKSDSSQTYTATVIPAGVTEDFPHQSTIIEVKTPKDSRREAGNRNEGTEDSSTTVVYKDTGKAMKASNSQTSQSLQATGGRGANLQEQSPTLSINTQYIISPDENNKKPGLALIITGQKFAIGNGDVRNGAEKDLRNMFEIFYNLNFEIRWKPFANKTTEDLKNALIKCAEDPTLEQKKCLVIIITSHGGEVKLGRPYRPENIPHDINVYGHAITTYNRMMPTNEILEIFDVDSCPYMEGKPKLLFIQACRARNKMKTVDKGHAVQVVQKQDIKQTRDFFNRSTIDPRHQEDDTNIIYNTVTMKDMLLTPCYQDFMVAFASTKEHIAWSENSGGVLLTAMYNVFKKKIDNKQDIDLLPTMTEVCSKMMDYESSFTDQQYDRSKAVMCLLHMLGEEIIFKPKY